MADKDWLKQLVRMAEEEQVDMVSTKMINYYVRDLIDNTGHFMLNTGEVMPHGFGDPIERHNKARDNFGACAGATLYSVKMLKKIGCFDDFFTTGYEDAELGVRALITGYKLRFQPEAIAYHKMSASINKVRNLDYMVYIQESIFFSYLKLMPKPVIILNIGFIIFRTLVLLFLFTIFMRWGYFRIYFKSLKKLNQDWSLLREKRRLFFQQNEVISSSTIIRKQSFFLWDNVKRFFIYFIQGKRTVFEKI
jgi:GT2 family glycosyltransferase